MEGLEGLKPYMGILILTLLELLSSMHDKVYTTSLGCDAPL